MAAAGNGYSVTKPRLPPQAGCRNMEVIRVMSQEESRGVMLEERKAGSGCGVHRGVVSISQGHEAWLQRLQGWP